MIVNVGSHVPLWLKLADGSANKYVVAYVSDNAGNFTAGSPYTLTHVQRGIYTAQGPVMLIDSAILFGSFEVYDNPNSVTQTYYASSEVYEPQLLIPAPHIIFITNPIKLAVGIKRIQGVIQARPSVKCRVFKDKVYASMQVPLHILGRIETPELRDRL